MMFDTADIFNIRYVKYWSSIYIFDNFWKNIM